MASKVTHSVDGRNPAPVDRQFIPLFPGFYTSQVVQCRISSINSITPTFPFFRKEPLSQAAQKASQLLLKVHQKEHRSNDVPKNTYLACQNLTPRRSTSTQLCWLVVSTHLKNISKNGNLPQVGAKMKSL